jgi:hypothetical protein
VQANSNVLQADLSLLHVIGGLPLPFAASGAASSVPTAAASAASSLPSAALTEEQQANADWADVEGAVEERVEGSPDEWAVAEDIAEAQRSGVNDDAAAANESTLAAAVQLAAVQQLARQLRADLAAAARSGGARHPSLKPLRRPPCRLPTSAKRRLHRWPPPQPRAWRSCGWRRSGHPRSGAGRAEPEPGSGAEPPSLGPELASQLRVSVQSHCGGLAVVRRQRLCTPWRVAWPAVRLQPACRRKGCLRPPPPPCSAWHS